MLFKVGTDKAGSAGGIGTTGSFCGDKGRACGAPGDVGNTNAVSCGASLLVCAEQTWCDSALLLLERAMGIEPTSVAWEATALPLSYARCGTPGSLCFLDYGGNDGSSVVTSLVCCCIDWGYFKSCR